MHDAIESDLLAARLPPFAHDEAAWIYVTARARLDPSLAPAHADATARAAWAPHGWTHPAAVAYLEHELGPLGDG